MFLHIGGSHIVFYNELVGIFNLDLKESEINEEFINNTSNNSSSLLAGSKNHKSFVVTDRTVYLSPISPRTLSMRRNCSL